ncbi:histidine kinase [Actinomycetospora endophytica]|uniref:histidine kinase n=1 Tax=Actinomycetospora endophytica TaxID=2291215 RepID=A0ABS8PEI3_9PSEU|nr:histidine kinase [Actinomycetospora endophytica]MCD2196695.1 histidine kinase [Actinomycetospora endophytica]
MPAPETDAREDRRRQEERWRRRRSLERQLHDGAALRISSLALRLGVLENGSVDPDDGARHRDIAALQDEVAAALEELRAVASQIYPPLLHEAGLGPALRELVTARQRDVVLDVAADRAEPAVEGAVYFALADCLEASGAPLAVRIRREPGTVEGGDIVVVVIEGADPALGPAVLDEAGPLGGTVDVEGAPGSAGTITARFPCA